jgi:hypothetical protein
MYIKVRSPVIPTAELTLRIYESLLLKNPPVYALTNGIRYGTMDMLGLARRRRQPEYAERGGKFPSRGGATRYEKAE